MRAPHAIHLPAALCLALSGLVPTAAAAASPVAESPAFTRMRALYEGLSEAQVRARGYEVEQHCDTAADLGYPPEAGAMGFHATNAQLRNDQMGGRWDPSSPPILLLDGSRRVVGVEWEASASVSPPPSLFGQSAPLVAEPAGMGDAGGGEQRYMLHAYFEPGGQVLFDTFNPDLACPLIGHLAASPAGSFANFEFDYPGDESVYTINLQVTPDSGTVLQRAGFLVFGPGGSLQATGGAQPSLRPNVSANIITRNRGRHVVQVYNYNPNVAIDFELTLVRGLPEGRKS